MTGQTSPVDVECELHGAADAGVQHLAHRLDPLGEIDRLRIDALPPRECQQLAGQGGAALCRGLDRGHRALKPGVVADVFLQGVEVAADDHQEIVEVVGDAAGELAERIELLRFRKMLLHLLELELGFAALGDVAGDLGKADQPAVFMDRIDDDAGPEERAVLADAPAFFFVAALLFSRF